MSRAKFGNQRQTVDDVLAACAAAGVSVHRRGGLYDLRGQHVDITVGDLRNVTRFDLQRPQNPHNRPRDN